MSETPKTQSLGTQLFRNVFNASPIGIAVESLDGQPLFVNPALCSFLGFNEGELRNKHCVDFSPREDAEKDWALFQQLKAGSIDHYQLEKRYYRKDGSLVWGSLSIALLNSRPSPLVIAMVEDITDKKRAEDDLHNANERLQLALESGSVGGWDYDLKTGKNLWFGKAHAQLGMAPDETSGSVEEFWDRVAEDDREHLRDAIRIAKDKHEEFTKDFRVVWRDGTIRWLRSRGRHYYAANGEPERMLGISLDITEQKVAEETLSRYGAIVESSEDAIASGTLDGTIVSWNAGAQHMYGYTEAEALGKPITMLVPPERQGEEKKILETLQAGGSVEQFETVRVTRSGKRINVSLSISPIKDSSGRVVKVCGIARDITRRKEAEEALREMNRALEEKNVLLQAGEELLRVFVKNVPVAVAMLDRDLRYLQVSDRWCSDNSVEASALLGRSRYEAGPEVPERWKEVNRRALQGETLRADEDPWESGGSTRWARWEVRPWRNPDDTIGGILVFAEDITRRKRMEEELSAMSRKLIESQEQERARIGRELHDDINQRLAMLAVQVEQLQENPSELHSRLRGLHKDLAEISGDVHVLSRELHSSKLEYLGVVAGMRSWCKDFAGRQKMEIDFKSHVCGALPLDIGRTLFRLLQEALHNVSKHSGVKRAEVQLREDSGEIHFIVSDTGRGFDVEAALQGQGLGLTSMRERVRLVNGTIAIGSKPLGGTTIHVRVPTGSEHAAKEEAV